MVDFVIYTMRTSKLLNRLLINSDKDEFDDEADEVVGKQCTRHNF